ncbi:MAG: hypothetical protein AAF600_06210 [Bacteroidota bacterium]
MKVLVNFNYSRKQWVSLLLPLFDHFEVHWIRYISKSEDEYQHISSHFYHYWGEYKDSNQILSNINPDFCIVMDNKAPLTIALIYQCKKKGIPVVLLHHGIVLTVKDMYVLESNVFDNAEHVSDIKRIKNEKNFNTIKFVFRSLNLRFFHPRIILFLLLVKIKGPKLAAFLVKDKIRIPTAYLCSSDQNAINQSELDGNISERLYLIGNPELDLVVNEYYGIDERSMPVNYWLHIDQPLSGGDLSEKFISEKDHQSIYKTLSELASSYKAKLYIKLHPGNYSGTNLPVDSNIVWLKEVKNLTQLIKGAKVCTGFFSNLLLPCIAFRPTILIKLFEISWYTVMGKYHNVEVVDDIKALFVNGEIPKAPSKSDSFSFLEKQGYTPKQEYSDRFLHTVNSILKKNRAEY